jgi:RimJ/RimL family protein N-acetyltransferase
VSRPLSSTRLTLLTIRAARPDDPDRIIGLVDEWWGRPVSQAPPRLFLDHFSATSWIAEDGEGLAGLLVSFVPPSQPEIAYVHFAAVGPDCRRAELTGALYERFFDVAHSRGCREVRAITAPENTGSIRVHESLSFSASGPAAGYNGPVRDAVLLHRELARSTAERCG